MEEKNELNDIILNKGGSSAGSKKIVLAVATLGVILIIVVMLMNTLTSKGTDNLPQAILPPKPTSNPLQTPVEEPLFEEVEVVQESDDDDSLDKIAQKLKEESTKSAEEVEVIVKEIPEAVTPTPKKVTAPVKKVALSGDYYIQVGSFSKYAPNKKFLDTIIKQGYEYKYHEVNVNSKKMTKVLVGPFKTEKKAREALVAIRTFLEAGAFLIKL
ncbi:SPOR domain-containing protein [Sulfurimonas sp.]|nr:SPOR domain-containing protein [Sulfurimonas sp.]